MQGFLPHPLRMSLVPKALLGLRRPGTPYGSAAHSLTLLLSWAGLLSCEMPTSAALQVPPTGLGGGRSSRSLAGSSCAGGQPL